MALFNIDRKKCKRDGICVADCPSQIIALADNYVFPSPIKNAEEFCINCGHCVAVCPHGAFKLATMPIAACPPLQSEFLPDAQTIQHFLMTRRSIRVYKKTPVSRKILESLINTARYAPTGSNKQQVHWMVFEKPAEVQKLAALVIDFMKSMIPLITDEAMARRMRRIPTAWDNGKDRILRGAPHLILVHAPAELPFAETDCVIALTYLELYAYAKGLGTCWAGYFTTASNMHKPLIEVLDLPKGHSCFGAVILGYPKFSYARIPKRNAPLITWR
ncbi:MAG: nitroreductase family protein [Syntrophales bacterium]